MCDNTCSDIESVINGGYCIGCGLCAITEPEAFQVLMNDNGQYAASIVISKSSRLYSRMIDRASAVCPFASSSANENVISSKLFKNNCAYNDRIGYYQRIYAGRVVSERLYQKSSSGGVLRSILLGLLEDKIVDSIMYVRNSSLNYGFEYHLTSSCIDIENSATSAYAPITLPKLLMTINADYNRYAIVGLPCFIKGLRNYFSEILNVSLKNQPILLGIVCGHLKSQFYGEMLAEQMGVPHQKMQKINFRKKLDGCKANEKGVSVLYNNGVREYEVTSTVKKLFGTDYGFGFFKYKSCDYCDDVFAETADASFGDAWIPRYINCGTSLIVVRSNKILNQVCSMEKSNDIHLDVVGIRDAIFAQNAGLRHRKEGLAFRLYLGCKFGKWVPNKRVKPSRHTLDFRNMMIQFMRMYARWKSTEEFRKFKENGDFQNFLLKMSRPWYMYNAFYGSRITIFPKMIFALLGIDTSSLKKWRRRVR